MLETDEDALICDFAEYYHLFDWRSQGVKQAAILACGLPDSSRIMKKLSKQRITLDQALMALILDDLNTLLWRQTKQGQKGHNRPQSVYKILNSEPVVREYEVFNSGDEFMKRWRMATKGEQ